MKKVETKKKVEKKVIWGAKSESGFKTLVKEARKNKNLFVLACTSSKDEKEQEFVRCYTVKILIFQLQLQQH